MTLLYAVLICILISFPIGVWGYRRCRKEKESTLTSIGMGFIVWVVGFEYAAFIELVIYWIHSHIIYG